MEYQNELKIIDTEHKAYLLGLLYADGSISYDNITQISLVDEQLITDLYKLFPFFNIGTFDYSIYNTTNKIQYSLRKKSEQLQKDLILNGLRFRKSTENADQLRLPTLSSNLMSHFIRGYFDGNGSISIPSNRPNLRRIEICSSSKVFIEDIKNYLETLNISCPYYRTKENINSTLYILEWIANSDVLIIKSFLYNFSTIQLNRKKEKFNSFRVIYRTENNPECKVCQEKLTKNGTRGNSIRYKCPKCNKNYTFPVPNKKSDELLESPSEKVISSQAISEEVEGSTTNSIPLEQ